MLSEPRRILKRTEDTVLGSIATWHSVWQELGCIPSGYPGPNLQVKDWEVSDAGNYAHLIHAIALWLIYQQGASEWELIKAQSPPKPLPAAPLPDAALKAQGLR